VRLVTYRDPTQGTARGGLVTVDDHVVDLAGVLERQQISLREVLEQGLLGDVAARCAGARPVAPLGALTLLPVIPDPSKIVCVGLNYADHAAEVAMPTAKHPVLFLRLPDSQTGHGQPILRPRESDALDFEGELAVVIGRPGRRIHPDSALAHVAGYACYNDASVRDWQMHTHQFTAGKNFPATGAFGPWLLTADEIADPADLKLVVRLNGVIVQQASVAQMLFPIATLISYISTFTPLKAGDVIVTGTPAGIGATRRPPLFMRHGDVISVAIDGLGALTNTVLDEPAITEGAQG
jgi:2-keto-4-pentenoate hydratase/2-oxohepta-3-ene-1,7-dioic acid hydratase in catechol pathway